jgi:hypothetical protein
MNVVLADGTRIDATALPSYETITSIRMLSVLLLLSVELVCCSLLVVQSPETEGGGLLIFPLLTTLSSLCQK